MRGMKWYKKGSIFFLIMLVMMLLSACGPAPGETLPTIVHLEEIVSMAEEEMTEESMEETDLSESEEEAGELALPVETEDLPVETTIMISAAGDVTLGNYFGQGYESSFNQTYEKEQNAGYFLQNVKVILSEDDMTIVNLEGVLTDSEDLQPGRTYNIKGAPEYVEILTEGSVEAVSFANNHRMDYGSKGSDDTINVLEEAEIVFAYDARVGYYVRKGIIVGFVSVNESTQGKGVEKYLEQGIAELQAAGADVILACCHWGTERDHYPEEYQQELGRKCIDWGADLVIGHHPHVLQGVEEYKGKFIVHSLGNFCFGANRNPADKDTMIFRQTFTFVDGVKKEDKAIQIIPCRISSVSNKNDYCPTPAQGEEAIRIIERINEFSKDMGVQFSENGYLAGQ